MKRIAIPDRTVTTELSEKPLKFTEVDLDLRREGSAIPCDSKQSRRLIPLTKWPEYHAWPSPQGLRYYVYNRAHNGFNKVLKKVGRRILIDEQAFFAWVEERHNKN